eukprot:gene5456-9269_t
MEIENYEKGKNPDLWNLKHNIINITRFLHDTTENQAKQGKDIQGMSFSLRYPRSKFKYERIERYKIFNKEYQNDEFFSFDEDKMTKVEDDSCFYKFKLNTRSARCEMTHFQLRHMIKSISKNEVLHMNNTSTIWKWNRVLYHDSEYGKNEKILDLTEENIKIVSLTGNENLLVCGGLHGELVVKSLKKDEVLFKKKISENENSISNFVELNQKKNENSFEIIVSSNDDTMRILNENFGLKETFKFEVCVNQATASKLNEKLISVLLDDLKIPILDKSTGKTVCTLNGHTHYPFSSCWNPTKEFEIATGAQDQTTRIWDIRKSNECLYTLPGKISSIRSVTYNKSGTLLAVSEAADFGHIYDATKNYKSEQILDVFGEISGITFAPNEESLFLGIYDQTYSSLIEFQKIRNDEYLNNILI